MNSPSAKSHVYWPSPTASVEQFLRTFWNAVFGTIVLILPHIRLYLQLSHCFKSVEGNSTWCHQIQFHLKLNNEITWWWGGSPCKHLGSPGLASHLQCHIKTDSSVTLWTEVHQAPLSMGFSRPEYWVGSHSLLQEIFPTQWLNPDLPHCRQILHCLSHQRNLPHFLI